MKRQTVLAGFAIFAMFFGSGNIVFPLSLGRVTGDMWALAMSGFFLTAVLVPFLGLMAIVLLKGDSKKFFDIITLSVEYVGSKIGIKNRTPSLIGSKLSGALQLFIISLIGPFGVIPRCISVSYGSYKYVDSTLPEYIFAGIFVLALLLLTFRPDRIIPIIGKLLTPIKFSLILLLIVLGLYWAPSTNLPPCKGFDSFALGTLNGYNTMDLTAAIFFAAAIMGFFRNKTKGTTENLLKDGFIACVIGASILSVIYVCFMYLGTKYAPITCDVPEVEILPTIATHALGSSASIAFSLTIVFSCLTTSVALIICWMNTLENLNILKNVPYFIKLILSLGVSYSIAVFLGFGKILGIMGPILQYIYPVLILMSVAHIVREYSRAIQS
jgi:LIVCS family branched-chain amino acid:cation transporter